MTRCETCALVACRDRGEAPGWDAVVRTVHWDLAHASPSSLEGWMVLVLRRHAATLAELTDDEAAELGPLLARVSRALTEVVPCTKTYAAQFAEDPAHPHVHVHVIPRSPDLADDERGPRVFARLGVRPDAAVGAERMLEVTDRLRAVLGGAG